jgi:hypothetical protein
MSEDRVQKITNSCAPKEGDVLLDFLQNEGAISFESDLEPWTRKRVRYRQGLVPKYKKLILCESGHRPYGSEWTVCMNLHARITMFSTVCIANICIGLCDSLPARVIKFHKYSGISCPVCSVLWKGGILRCSVFKILFCGLPEVWGVPYFGHPTKYVVVFTVLYIPTSINFWKKHMNYAYI